MKKLLLVGVVGLSALLGGCGGGDCEEEVLPPVTESQFPRGQAPEYVVRKADEVELSRAFGNQLITGQVLSLEMAESRPSIITVQEFDASYEGGYMTKPTNNVRTFNGYFRAQAGGQEMSMTHEDLLKLRSDLMTVALRETEFNDEGVMTFAQVYLSVSVSGKIDTITSDTIRINGMDYPLGFFNPSEVVEGDYATGFLEGSKLNFYKLTFSNPAGGYSHEVVVDDVMGTDSFTYLNAEGNSVVVELKPLPYPGDEIQDASVLSKGSVVVVQGFTIDNNDMVARDANVYLIKE